MSISYLQAYFCGFQLLSDGNKNEFRIIQASDIIIILFWDEKMFILVRKVLIEQHAGDRKYNVFSDNPKTKEFTVMQVVDMAQLFYRQDQEDALSGVKEYDRLWTLNCQHTGAGC